MKTFRLLSIAFVFGGIASAFAQAPGAVPAPVDSMAFYAQTKKPAIADPDKIEFAGSIRADGKVMIVQADSREKPNRYRLYEHRLDANGKWGPPISLDSINLATDSATLIGGPSLSFDGNILYFFMDNDIFYSERKKDGWGKPINIGAPINTKEYEGFPSISSDGRTLYFVGNNTEQPRAKELRKKEFFCPCIFRSLKDQSGKWGKPERLPYPINQDCEKAPRIMADGKTLIFSSMRPGGKGGYDLYQTALSQLGSWNLPLPLSFINTEDNDLSPSISAEGDIMYYTHAGKDIYSVTIPPSVRQFRNNIIRGSVTDQDTKAGIGVDIIVSDAFTSETVLRLNNNPEDGKYTVVLPVGRTFNIEFKKDGYSSFAYTANLAKVKQYQEMEMPIELFKTVKLSISINDKEILEPLAAEIKIKVKGESLLVRDLKTNAQSGRVSIELPLGKDYEIIASAPSFKSSIVDFNTSGLIIYRDFEKFVDLLPEKKDVMINVADRHNNAKVNSKVILRNKNRDEVIEVSGNQMVSLRSGDRYEIEVSSDQGYAFDSRVLDLAGGGEQALDFKLQKLELDAKLVLKDINFESNSTKLSDVSYAELNRVVKLLTENPTIKVEISAHTDDIGSDSYNQILSQKRAQSVVEFLMQNRILQERFVANGYGKRMSKVPNTSEENRSINRRVELKILGI